MEAQVKEKKSTSPEVAVDDYGVGVEPYVSKKYEPAISIAIVIGALLLLGFAVLTTGILG